MGTTAVGHPFAVSVKDRLLFIFRSQYDCRRWGSTRQAILINLKLLHHSLLQFGHKKNEVVQHIPYLGNQNGKFLRRAIKNLLTDHRILETFLHTLKWSLTEIIYDFLRAYHMKDNRVCLKICHFSIRRYVFYPNKQDLIKATK